MSTVERIQQLLDCAVVRVKDNAGIIIPSGVDQSVRVKALEECLKIAKEEEHETLQAERVCV